MHFLEMMREGGPLAMVAVALGLLGVIFGGLSLVLGLGGSRAGFGLGIATLIIATLASAAGIGGTLLGKKQVEDALVFVDNDVDKSRILKMGHKEASGAATLGAFAALLPLLLGAVGALSGARAQRTPSRQQGLEIATGPQTETSGRAVLCVVFIGIAALAASGAWVTGHRPPPAAKFDFDDADQAAWALASAVSDVQRAMKPFKADADSERSQANERASQRFNACRSLETALTPYRTSAPEAWPRKMDGIPPVLEWRAAADACVRSELEPAKGTTLTAAMTTDALLESVLLQDDALRRRVLEKKNEPNEAPPAANDEPTVGVASLDRESIQKTIRGRVKFIQACFERALVKNPKLEGKLEIEMVIGATGKVTKSGEVDTKFPDVAVVSCVVKEIEKLKFPSPEGGGIVTVRYPFVFKAAQ